MSSTRFAIGAGVIALMTAFSAAAQELVSIDIGDAVDTPGSTTIDGDAYTIVGNGSDIWNAADGFRYAYTEVTGDFEAVVHQLSTDLPKEWSKGGIHARQSTDAGAQNAQAIVTGGGASGAQLTWRSAADGSTDEFADTAPNNWWEIECWVKLTRTGNEFAGYVSTDGSNWQDLLSVEVVMEESALVGIAVCGVGVDATAAYDGFTVVADGVTVFPHLVEAAVDARAKATVTWGAMKAR